MFSNPITSETKQGYLFHNRFGWTRADSSNDTKYRRDKPTAFISKDQTVYSFQFRIDNFSQRINTLLQVIIPDLWSALRRQIKFINGKVFHSKFKWCFLQTQVQTIKSGGDLRSSGRYSRLSAINPSFLTSVNWRKGSRSSKRGIAKVYRDCIRI